MPDGALAAPELRQQWRPVRRRVGGISSSGYSGSSGSSALPQRGSTAHTPATRHSPLTILPPPLRRMSEETVGRRALFSKVLGASAALAAASPALAEIDYAGVGFLGGSSTIDVNNANVRVYTKLPGLYPNAAGKIVSGAPYKSKEEMYSKAKFTAGESAAVKKYDSRFIFLEPKPEYVIDNINNGLYR